MKKKGKSLKILFFFLAGGKKGAKEAEKLKSDKKRPQKLKRKRKRRNKCEVEAKTKQK